MQCLYFIATPYQILIWKVILSQKRQGQKRKHYIIHIYLCKLKSIHAHIH